MKKLFIGIIWLLLTIPPIVFFTNLTRNPYYFQIFLLNIIILFFWIVFSLNTITTGKLKWSLNIIDLPLLCFASLAVLSFVYTYFFPPQYLQPEIISEGKKIINTDYVFSSIFSEGSKKVVFTLVNVLMAYWIATNFITKENLKKMFHVLFIVGFIAAFYAILQYFGIEPIWPKVLNPFSGRPVSTFGNPNFMSSYLVVLFPVIFSYYLSNISLTKKLFYLLILIIYFVSLLCTLTRSSWIGLFTALVFVLWFLYKEHTKDGTRSILSREKKWILALVIIIVFSFLFLPRNKFGAPSTVRRITEITDVTKKVYPPVHQRLMIWSCSWEMVRENPVIGKGWGLFELFYPFHQGKYLFNSIYRGLRTHANNAHNEILEIWSQTGTIGLGLYLWFLITGLIYGMKLTNSLQNEKKILAICILAGIIGMFVDNIFGNVSLQFCVPAFLFWWNIGVLTTMDTTRKTYEFKIGSITKMILLVLIAIFCFLIYRAYNHFMGETNYFKGFKFSKRNDVLTASKYLELAHKHNREVNSEYELANCYARSGQKDKAIWAYYQALAANCGYDEIHFNLATIYAQKNDKKNAIMNYTQALSINPASKEGYLALGNVFLNDIDNFQSEGIELFNQSAYFYPDNPDIWNNLGYLYTRTGQDENAIQAYKKALELNPEFEHAKRNLKAILKKLGKTDESIFRYDRLIKKIEQKINTKNWVEVKELCEQLVKLAPNSFKARFYLANVLLTSGKIDDAIKEYNEAIRIDNRSIFAHSNLGLAYLEKGQHELAKVEFQKILQLDPQNQLAKEKLKLINSMR